MILYGVLLVFWLSVHSPYLHSDLIQHKALETIKQNILAFLQHRLTFRSLREIHELPTAIVTTAQDAGGLVTSKSCTISCNVVGRNVNSEAINRRPEPIVMYDA